MFRHLRSPRGRWALFCSSQLQSLRSLHFHPLDLFRPSILTILSGCTCLVFLFQLFIQVHKECFVLRLPLLFTSIHTSFIVPSGPFILSILDLFSRLPFPKFIVIVLGSLITRSGSLFCLSDLSPITPSFSCLVIIMVPWIHSWMRSGNPASKSTSSRRRWRWRWRTRFKPSSTSNILYIYRYFQGQIELELHLFPYRWHL